MHSQEEVWSPCSTICFLVCSTEMSRLCWGAHSLGQEVCDLREDFVKLLLHLHLWMVSACMVWVQASSETKHVEILKLQLLCPNSTVCCRERHIAHKRASVSD